MSGHEKFPAANPNPWLPLPPGVIKENGNRDVQARLGAWFSGILFLAFVFGGFSMFHALILPVAASLATITAILWHRRNERQHEFQMRLITPERLHDLLETRQKPVILDLRVPLDFLAHTEIIPGAHRIAPSEIIADPNIIPKDADYVLYCTCPGEDSSEVVLEAALRMGFLRVRVLEGGIEAWKNKGYPVEIYDKPFHLDIQ